MPEKSSLRERVHFILLEGVTIHRCRPSWCRTWGGGQLCGASGYSMSRQEAEGAQLPYFFVLVGAPSPRNGTTYVWGGPTQLNPV